MSISTKEENYLPLQVQSLLIKQEEQKRRLEEHEKRLERNATKEDLLRSEERLKEDILSLDKKISSLKGDLFKLGGISLSVFLGLSGFLWSVIQISTTNQIYKETQGMEEKIQNLEIHVSRLEASGKIERGGH